MTKIKVDILYFARDALTRSAEDRRVRGEMFLEKRPKGKWLCFKKEGTTYSIPLTKKMYKSLNRFTSGIRMERFYGADADEEILLQQDMVEDSQDYDCEGDESLYYMKGGRALNAGGRQCNLPAVSFISHKPKEKAAFVTQLFKYVSPTEKK